jgi:hypothetical protein
MSDHEFLIQLLEKIGDDISRINDTIDKNQDKINSFIVESSSDRKALRSLVDGLQIRIEHISKTLGLHKKKGLWALFIATITGGAIASGTINYNDLIPKLFKLNGH